MPVERPVVIAAKIQSTRERRTFEIGQELGRICVNGVMPIKATSREPGFISHAMPIKNSDCWAGIEGGDDDPMIVIGR